MGCKCPVGVKQTDGMHDCMCKDRLAIPCGGTMCNLQQTCQSQTCKEKAYLIIATAPCMQFATHWANDFCEPAFIGCMNVLVPRLDFEVLCVPLYANFAEALDYCVGFLLSQDSCFGQSFCIRLAALQSKFSAYWLLKQQQQESTSAVAQLKFLICASEHLDKSNAAAINDILRRRAA